MKLYKCWNSDITVKSDVLFIWAESEDSARDGIANINSKKESFKDWLFDTTLGELLDEGVDPRLFQMLDVGEQASANEVYRQLQLPEWTVEEIFIPQNCDLIACYPEDLENSDEVILVSVPLDVQDGLDFIYEVLAEDLANKEHFINFVHDYGINCSLAEFFFQDEQGTYLFEFDNKLGRVLPNEWVMDMFDGDLRECHRYIDEQFENNVSEFFTDEPGNSVIYLNFMSSKDTSNLDSNFVKYVAKKLLIHNEKYRYLKYEIERVLPYDL